MEPVEFHSAPLRIATIAAAGVVMTAGSAALAFRVLPDIAPGSFPEFIGYVGLIFFGFCTLFALRLLVTARGPIVTISTDGIRDTRVARDVIPWKAVRGIGTWALSGQNTMVLAVDPDVEARLGLTRVARMTRKANAALGADGLCVTAQGIKADHDTLISTSMRYWKAATGG